MLLTLSYPSSRPFNKTYTAIIAILLLAALAGISAWTLFTKKDCVPYTSSTLEEGCQPYNLFNEAEVRQSHDGIIPFVYKDRISGLATDYKYTNTPYSCLNMTRYRIVLNADRSTQINYNASCFFHDEARVEFNLLASSVSNDVGFGWDSDFNQVECSHGKPYFLQSLIFADNDGDGAGIPLGLNIDDSSCRILVCYDANDKIAIFRPKKQPDHTKLLQVDTYALYKRQMAKTFAINSDMKFAVGYTCSRCSRKSGWDLLLTLLTSMGSLGGMVYTVLIYLGQKMYTRRQDDNPYDSLDLEKLTPDRSNSGRGAAK
ncbi:hypothetical protein BGZ70_009621 [Mortierella alpina]|uniref:Uncharacterized protein n=1 Tax=Mortierella alpina TaxID=64518 RepID=A0A9P6J1F9_MORAP|nr:hypothetical protein BGZ70_009621 [Mortierella alpina]